MEECQKMLVDDTVVMTYFLIITTVIVAINNAYLNTKYTYSGDTSFIHNEGFKPLQSYVLQLAISFIASIVFIILYVVYYERQWANIAFVFYYFIIALFIIVSIMNYRSVVRKLPDSFTYYE